MSDFLEQFDKAIERAKQLGRPCYLQDKVEYRDPFGMWGGRVTADKTARTRHPAFMADRPAKHDPTRDNS
jgi:hypothetical protein